jgi:uncharacterized membrane protein HdeD (DUF308 family)
MLATLLSRYWWVLLIRGLLAIAFGLMAYAWPGLTLGVLILFFGAYALVDGISSVASAIGGHAAGTPRWPLVLRGVLGIVAGLLTLFAPGITAVALLLYIAVWAILTGIAEIVTAIRLRREIEGEWLLALSGLASVVFGVLLIARPGIGALAVVWLIAAYAIVYGVLLVALAFRARRFAHRPGAVPSRAAR